MILVHVVVVVEDDHGMFLYRLCSLSNFILVEIQGGSSFTMISEWGCLDFFKNLVKAADP